MRSYSPTIPARYIKVMAEYVTSLGFNLGEILAATDLETALIETPDAMVTMEQFDVLLAAFEAATGRSDLGFQFGRRVQLESHGALGLALPFSLTVDHVLRLVSRYYELIIPAFVLEYRRESDFGEFIFRPVAPMSSRVLRMFLELHAVAVHMQMATLLGSRMRPYDIHLAIERPAHADLYRELRPARVHFGSLPLPEVRVRLEAAQLDTQLPNANRQAVQQMERRLGRLSPGERGRWSDWVCMMLREAEDCQPTLEQMAGLLNMTARTLHRYLASENHSFRELSLMVRHERACRLLESGTMPISHIAYRLGYTDVANFSHAFRRSSGISPRACRDAAQPAAARH